MTLPIIALALGVIAAVTQQVRGWVLDALRQDWVRTLRSRGLPERRVSGVRHELFVDAARVSGVTDTRIIGRHILTVVRAPVIIQASIVVSIAIAIQAGLDFLGFGDPTIPTWGNMLNDGFTNLYRDPELVLWPALAIAVTCIALTLFANALRDELEHTTRPRRRRRRAAATAAETTTADAALPGTGTIAHEEPDSPGPASLLRVEHLAVGYPQGGRLGHPRGRRRVTGDRPRGGPRPDRRIEVRQDPDGLVGAPPATTGRADPGRIRPVRLPRRERRTLASQIQVVFQDPYSSLNPSLTIEQTLTEPLLVQRMPKKEATARVRALLDQVKLPSDALGRLPREFSGGQRQRIAIARALALSPTLIVCDEPVSALGLSTQARRARQ